jgi:UDP-GlcNAc:undecaprenyl-phosphate/decaprenyl-phosphate GlcNAc-1-phosphate transferase
VPNSLLVPSIPPLQLGLGFALALVSSLVLVPVVRHYALKADLLDAPGERKIHSQPIPRLGGVAIFVSFLVALGCLGAFGQLTDLIFTRGNLGLIAGGTLMFLLGLLDDLVNLSPYVKLAGQFLASIVAFGMGVSVDALDLPGSMLLVLNALSFPVTVLWLVGISNAVNFIDGIDGLAGGVGVLSSLTMVVVALFTGQPQAALLAALLAGACLGFLIYNTNPAKIFMGDSGALFIGFTLACLGVVGVLKTYTVVMLTPMVVLCVPVLDITYSTLRRLLRGKNPFVADGDHLHHRLLKAGLSQRKTVFAFYLVCVFSGLLVSHYVRSDWFYLKMVGGVALLAVALLALLRMNDLKAKGATPLLEPPPPADSTD